jgi:inhibitor of cysteine peptidase
MLLPILISLIMLLGCGGSPAPEEVKLVADDAGGSVTIQPGGRLTLTLESNPTTGYSWALTELDETVVIHTGDEYSMAESSEGIVGGGGVEVWRFAAVGPGTTTLRLEYVRPWEANQPADEFEVTLTVAAGTSDSAP